ncbi:toxic anion resistance protein [Ligilactobacillus sp. 110_WCHN]|uniref:toxic anion resistance protein n=1 Tax=Ligilactobacillus sp. 110_WCHN TaxID=3057125 RepID=UPI002673EEA6|nr:toxic anion resistance protein [Ligilactobacillus sp. 110_WCHN]MDO3393077.1 toxic anion resistance protein [Ligilactobacillus sp. 110_WCHN]
MNNENEPLTVTNGQSLPTEVAVKDEDLLKIKSKLTPEQLVQAQNYAVALKDSRQNAITDYGKEIQDQMSQFTDEVIGNVKSKEVGEIGDTLQSLVTSLNSADPEKLSGDKKPKIFRLFKKIKDSVFEMTAKYQEVSAQIGKIATKLENQENDLLKNNDMLDEMYTANQKYFQQLNTLIVGGQIRRDELNKEMAALQADVDAGKADQMDVQNLQDMKAQADRLDHRLSDLMLTREITIQQAPQIRLIQNNNSVLSEKIQSSITTAIPLWKNQVAIALSLLSQKDAVKAQDAVANTTNELLKKNSEMLHESTVDVAKASQRGLVDVDTLKETQENLISTIQEVMQIQSEGTQKRQAIEGELAQMEDHLKTALIPSDSKTEQ